MTWPAPETRIIALDVETTGLSPSRDRLVEVAAICWQGGHETGHFQALINPGMPIPFSAIRIHGITDAMVREAPAEVEVLPAFFDFCAGDVLVAHNARFDLSFLRAAARRHHLAMPEGAVYDTCSLARKWLPGHTSYSLESLKYALGLGRGQEHRALQDARDCLGVFLRLLDAGLTPHAPGPELPAEVESLLGDLRAAIVSRSLLWIEYRDGRGRTTKRRIQPLGWYEEDRVVEAHCHLRNETRHFHLTRIVRLWRDG